MKIRVFDNGGKTFDRYTIAIIQNGSTDMYGMSNNANMPNGFNQFIGNTFFVADSVEIAFNAGIKTVIQPGGSVRDQESIDFCNEHGMAMVFTGIRHFKH